MHGIFLKDSTIPPPYKPYNFCRVYNKFLCSTLAGQAQANLLIIKTYGVYCNKNLTYNLETKLCLIFGRYLAPEKKWYEAE